MSKEIDRRYIDALMRVEKRTSDKSDESTEFGVIEGYAAKYNEETEINGWFKEVIRPGFFDDVLNDDVRCLINHNPQYILARSVNGKGTLQLEVDNVGLKYKYTTPDITYAKDLQKSIERGDISQSSFSFIPKEVVWHERKGDMELRELIKCERLFDVSPVTFPAYNNTEVAKRSWEEFKKNKKTSEKKSEVKIIDEYEARHRFNLNKCKL